MAPVIGPQVPVQFSDTETYSKNILGPVYFTLSNLRVEGQAGTPALPKTVAPEQSPYIVANNEEIKASVDIQFNDSPLTRLLLCLGTTVEVCFSFEAIGAKADDADLTASIKTEKDKLSYTVTWEGTPEAGGMKPGFYAGGAVATIGPAMHPCAQFVFGYGYIAKVLLQVYAAFSH